MRNFLFITLLIFASAASSQALASTVTASHTHSPDVTQHFSTGAGMATDGSVYDNREAQTFTATTGGFLNTISFVAKKSTGTTADLRITLTELIDAQPGMSLASGLIDTDSFALKKPGNRDYNFTATINFYSENILLKAGQKYAILFSTDTTEANYRLHGDQSDYPGGYRLKFKYGGPYKPDFNGSDLYFEVTVNSISKLSRMLLMAAPAIFLMATAALIIYLKRRRNKLRQPPQTS